MAIITVENVLSFTCESGAGVSRVVLSTTTPPPPPPAGVLFGVYHGAAPGGPSNVNAFSAWVGRNVDLALDYTAIDNWANVEGPAWQLGPWRDWVQGGAGRNFIYSVGMFPSGGTLENCASGAYNPHWAALANNLVAYGLGGAILRLGWEANGSWEPWNFIGRETTYVNAFRQIVTTMRATQPGATWKFDWCQAADWNLQNTAYPGDAYVDYIGLDIYDMSWAANTYPYPNPCDAACHTTRQTNAWNDLVNSLNKVRDWSIASGKKVGIAEWGVANRSDGHGGLDNPSFVQRMYDYITNPANNVAYHSYFDFSPPGFDSRISTVGGASAFPNASALFQSLF